jgi:hypothetical protein
MPLAVCELFREPGYERAWSAMIAGLQGDCTMVPYADTYHGKTLAPHWVELLAANYPDRPQYLALLRELCGEDLARGNARYATWYREPGLESRPSAPLRLEDFCPPELRVGHMRTGSDGRESLLLLSASHWGIHHHLDSLNLYYWKDGHELLSDLGYLWDNPKKSMTSRTLAHNTLLIDEQNQRTRERGGTVHFFEASPHVKVMRASSNAYEGAKKYQRTAAIIDHGEGRNYVVDFFVAEGGETQDLVFHGPHEKFTVRGATTRSASAIYDLVDVRAVTAKKPWRIVWPMGERSDFGAWSLPQGERTFIGAGWGQRDSFNADQGVTIPYIVRRTTGEGERRFISIFELHPRDKPFVRDVKLTRRGRILEIHTAESIDYVENYRDGFKVTCKSRGRTRWTFMTRQR